MSRRSYWPSSVALLAGGLTACATPPPADFPTATELPDDERRARGIAVDLPSEPPSVRDHADADDAIVSLRTPLGDAVAQRVVRELLAAAVQEDPSALSALMAPGALLYELGARHAQVVHNAHQAWRNRFRKHEYQELGRKLLFREADVAIYRGERIQTLPSELQVGTIAPAATDVVLLVPIATPLVRSERVFGDEIVFWLRREGDRYVIYQMAEDYTL